LKEYFLDKRPPLEAQLIDLADEIAYLTADLDDGLDSGILTVSQIRESVPMFRRLHDSALADYPAAAPRLLAYEALKRILNAFVTDLVKEVRARVAATGATSLEEIRHAPERLASLSPAMEAERATAKKFLYLNFYNSPGMEEAHAHATCVVEGLFASLMDNPSLLPPDHQTQIPTEGMARTVADYIAGMTDSYIDQLWARYCAQ
jgi:dGTPase